MWTLLKNVDIRVHMYLCLSCFGYRGYGSGYGRGGGDRRGSYGNDQQNQQQYGEGTVALGQQGGQGQNRFDGGRGYGGQGQARRYGEGRGGAGSDAAEGTTGARAGDERRTFRGAP